MAKNFLKKALVVATLCSYNFVGAESKTAQFIFSVDSLRVMQESNEGKAMLVEFEKLKEEAIKKITALENDLKTQQETLQKQAALLKPEALKERALEIQNKEKKIARDKEEVADEVNGKFQARQEKLFASQLEITRKVFENKSKDREAILIDSRTPGVLAVAKNTDITPDVLTEANAKWDAEQKKATKQA